MPNLTGTLEGQMFNGVSISHITNLGSITSIGHGYNEGSFNSSSLEDVVLPETLTKVLYTCFNECTNIRYIKILANTVPTYNGINGFNNQQPYSKAFGELYKNNKTSNNYIGHTYPIYVKDELLSDYQTTGMWQYVGPNRLRPLSQFATDFPNG